MQNSTLTTLNIYVDVDTGEEISRTEAARYYLIINKHKNVKVNNSTSKRYMEITNECRKLKYRTQELKFDEI